MVAGFEPLYGYLWTNVVACAALSSEHALMSDDEPLDAPPWLAVFEAEAALPVESADELAPGVATPWTGVLVESLLPQALRPSAAMLAAIMGGASRAKVTIMYVRSHDESTDLAVPDMRMGRGRRRR